MNTSLPRPSVSDDARFDSEADEFARRMISAEDLALSPEEYAARHAHEWGLFSLHRFRYRDPVLGAWVRRLGELFDDPEELERCRERLLTPQAREEIHLREVEEF